MGGKRAAGAAFLLLVSATAPAPSRVDYSIGLAGEDRLAVEMRFAGDSSGETEIDLPDHWAGTTQLWRGIAGFRVEGGTVSGQDGTRMIRHRPGAPLIVRYEVQSGARARTMARKHVRR